MPVQYARWAAHLFDGDLGLSYKYKQPVTEVIGKVWVNTLILGGVSYVLTFGLAILLGLFCALREDSLLDRIICKVGVISGSVPSFPGAPADSGFRRESEAAACQRRVLLRERRQLF